MKRACSPNSITSLNYSSVTIECLERPDVLDDTESYISGRVFRDGKLAWLVRGATLEVINPVTGLRHASYRFGWSPHQQRSVCISSVSELHIEDGTKLLVGMKDLSGRGGGIVCIFDPFVSRVIKAIGIPYPVTVLECVTSSGGAQASPHAFRFVFGVHLLINEYLISVEKVKIFIMGFMIHYNLSCPINEIDNQWQSLAINTNELIETKTEPVTSQLDFSANPKQKPK